MRIVNTQTKDVNHTIFFILFGIFLYRYEKNEKIFVTRIHDTRRKQRIRK